MITYISLLRGINVSGQKPLPMADLKQLYESLKFKNVVTYIQSGNVIFTTDKKEIEITSMIEKAIVKKFGFEVPVMVRKVKEFENVVATNPYTKSQSVIEKRYVTFLEETPEATLNTAINKIDLSPDQFWITGKEIFLYCENGYGKTKLSNNFFENKLKVKATTRNWKTVNKLIGLANALK